MQLANIRNQLFLETLRPDRIQHPADKYTMMTTIHVLVTCPVSRARTGSYHGPVDRYHALQKVVPSECVLACLFDKVAGMILCQY